MLRSFGRPSKYVISLAAIGVDVTKLLRTPHMLTSTSLEGPFSCSSGSFATRWLTSFVAGHTSVLLAKTSFNQLINISTRTDMAQNDSIT